MKIVNQLIRFFTVLFAALGIQQAAAQTSGAVITTQPSSFTGDDQVKIIVDVSNVPNLAGQGPLYVWTWHPNEPAPGNGQWNNSNEERKMVQEGPNRWSWTIVPKDFYGVDAASITEIRFLVKAKDASGDKKTDDIILKVSPLVFIPTDFRSFPRVASADDVVTIYFDQTLATDLKTQRMTPTAAKLTLYNESGTQIGTEKTISLKKEGDKLHSFMLIPRLFFGVAPTVAVGKMKVEYTGTIPDINGTNVPATSVPYEKAFDNLQ